MSQSNGKLSKKEKESILNTSYIMQPYCIVSRTFELLDRWDKQGKLQLLSSEDRKKYEQLSQIVFKQLYYNTSETIPPTNQLLTCPELAYSILQGDQDAIDTVNNNIDFTM